MSRSVTRSMEAANTPASANTPFVLPSPSFLPHLPIKLKDETFIIWKNQLLNIIMVNGLENYVNGRAAQPIKFLDKDRIVENSDFVT